MELKQAERRRAKLRCALSGPAGSGKTVSALRLARGLVGPDAKIGVIDVGGEGVCQYVGNTYDKEPPVEFAEIVLSEPYTPMLYVQAIQTMADAGMDVLVIDSLSPAWSGTGGVLEMVDNAAEASRAKNSWAAWREVTPEHNRLVNAMLEFPGHLIATMRTKMAWDIVEEKGKKRPVKIGLAPVQREGMEYEFTVVFDLSVEKHIATVSKDRTGLFDGKHQLLTAKVGEMLRGHLETGVPSLADQYQAAWEAAKTILAQAPDLATLQEAWKNANQAQKAWGKPYWTKELIDIKEARKKSLIAAQPEQPKAEPTPEQVEVVHTVKKDPVVFYGPLLTACENMDALRDMWMDVIDMDLDAASIEALMGIKNGRKADLRLAAQEVPHD